MQNGCLIFISTPKNDGTKNGKTNQAIHTRSKEGRSDADFVFVSFFSSHGESFLKHHNLWTLVDNGVKMMFLVVSSVV